MNADKILGSVVGGKAVHVVYERNGVYKEVTAYDGKNTLSIQYLLTCEKLYNETVVTNAENIEARLSNIEATSKRYKQPTDKVYLVANGDTYQGRTVKYTGVITLEQARAKFEAIKAVVAFSDNQAKESFGSRELVPAFASAKSDGSGSNATRDSVNLEGDTLELDALFSQVENAE